MLNFERGIRPKFKLRLRASELWQLGNERFNSFRVVDKVLKSRIEIERLNVNKFKDKYESPHEVKQVWGNGAIYVLEKSDEDGKRKEVRAHQSQLRKWKEPPLYLKTHPVYELCRLTTSGGENRENEDIINLKEMEIVLAEERGKKWKIKELT